jgi:hypothetical protein
LTFNSVVAEELAGNSTAGLTGCYMPTHILLVRHPGLTPIPEESVLRAVPPEHALLPREDHEINTQPHAVQVEQGDWTGHAAYLAEEAAKIHAIRADKGDVDVHYFGLAEIPHVIALGALIGDEVPVILHDYDRDAQTWQWPSEEKTVETQILGIPTGSQVAAPGSAILRVELSFAIADTDIHDVVGLQHLADVRVVLAEGLTPAICKVRSQADLQGVRLRIREALAALRAKFPNLETIHVFAAAPVSVCFALGQELKPRNSPPIQTYRYRKVEGRSSYRAAIELSSQLESQADRPLTPEQLEEAAFVRALWREALQEVEAYASAKRGLQSGAVGPWYSLLTTIEHISDVRPFPALPDIGAMVPSGASVADSDLTSEFRFLKPDKVWNLSDRLLLGLHNSTGRTDDETRSLVRIFLFHEYLHEHHSLTAYRSADVGSFPNTLEYLDYTADSYALLHQLDLQTGSTPDALATEAAKCEYLAGQVERVVRSFWAFEPRPPVSEWQVRRLRRYLNWYWRYTQLREVNGNLVAALRVLSRPPHVEISGLHQYARGQRVYCRLDGPDVRTRPEVAVVLENEKLLRVPDSTTFNIAQLLTAFQNGDHHGIVEFFVGIFERAQELGGALRTD